jgi:pyruvate dehydrogenase E2 component (dihydrolipoamide acetyltransferase)
MDTAAPSTYDYELPSLGADMDAGRVVEWIVSVGDVVHRGDVVARVETEKSDIDIEIWRDGVVETMLVEIGAEIAVGTPILRLALDERAVDVDQLEESEQLERAGAVGGVRTPPWPSVDMERHATPERRTTAGRPVVLASPLARRLAVRHGVALADVAGTGPRGAVVSADIQRCLEPTDDVPRITASPRPDDSSRSGTVDPMRRLIAERMAQSNRDIPHYYLQRDIDVTALTNWLQRENSTRDVSGRLLPAAALVRAVALAVRRHPELNGYWKHDRFEAGESINVAMAISLRRGGLVTPSVNDADTCSLDDTMARLKELVAASRTGSLRSSWMTGATITVTNLGDHGADLVHGVISPPQVALVGFGRPVERPWVVDGQLAIRTVMTATLAADHRATDGVTGSRFLTTLSELLEDPEEL